MDMWDRLFAKAGGKCTYCDHSLLTDLEVYFIARADHLIPKAAGGPDTEANLTLACEPCNAMKSNFNPAAEAPHASRRELIAIAREEVQKRRMRRVAEFERYCRRFEASKQHENVQADWRQSLTNKD